MRLLGCDRSQSMPMISRVASDVSQRVPRCPLAQVIVEPTPSAVKRAWIAFVAHPPAKRAKPLGWVRIDSRQDIHEGDFLGRARQGKTSSLSLLRVEEAGEDQTAQDLGEIMRGNPGRERQVCRPDRNSGGCRCQPGHRTARVFGGLRDQHCSPSGEPSGHRMRAAGRTENARFPVISPF